MKKQLHFDKVEFATRLSAVKREMSNRGLDVLLVVEPANQNYLTGYSAYSFYTPQMVIVCLDRDEPMWVGRFMDRVSATMTTYLAETNIRAYPDQYVASATLSAFDFMADVVKEVAGEKPTIGVEFGGFYYSARAHADLVKALPNAKIVDADLIINWIRIVKSPAEVAIMRQAGGIADAMMCRAIQVIEPGVRECDIAAAVYHQQISGTSEFGGSYASTPPFLCIGPRQVAPHADWTDDPLPPSTIVNLELFANRYRYQVNLARTVSVGKPTAEYEKLSEIVVEALNTGLETARPGATAEEVSTAFSRKLAKYGIEKEARVGYPIGVGFPPSMQDRTASLRRGDTTVLKPGMCFHMMSGLWLKDTGITITQSFVVTEQGHEPLTEIPRKLFVK
ncbi:M24 family metallopeptidase [Mesorhizobium sp. B4-1-4]|uniref:M24 family metallopeptidase n=1 Tax=Mesorhizobium sp. B4-1-4 TaxID=2589888 RepID=UPI00112906C1|nr:Xaa-Pro peptidase family protein [Mesorhizobium sp. B4-1-4]UCI31980.1 Xaa-Pro peptidase family protein [Mesorhizobium sp. B4-1-4]